MPRLKKKSLLAEYDAATALATRATFLKEAKANAKRWAASGGKAELTAEVLETLLVNLQIEKAEGQSTNPEEAGHARACRKQYRETMDAVLDILSVKG